MSVAGLLCAIISLIDVIAYAFTQQIAFLVIGVFALCGVVLDQDDHSC